MEHELKIKQCFLIHLLEDKKHFEIRKNDRDFQVGDTISFIPLEDDSYDVYKEYSAPLPHAKIIYVHTGLGMQDGYAALDLKFIDT